MANPFSIIQVVDTSTKVAQLLTNLVRDLKGAPDELLALSNEAWTLKLILDEVRELEKSHDEPSARKLDASKALIYQTRIKLDRLTAMINRWGKLSPWGTLSIWGEEIDFYG